jgi:quinol monooxygenase YgiN
MSVAIVARLRVRPRRIAALVREFERLFASWQARRLGHQNAQLFQGITNPDHVIYVGEWETREAASAAVQSPAIGEALDPLLAFPARFDHYQLLQRTEFMARRTRAVSCAFVEGAETTADAVRDCLRTATKEIMAGSPGFVRQLLYENVDVLWRFFALQGWDSVRSLEAAKSRLSDFTAPLGPLGAVVEAFEGVERAAFP